MKSAIRPAVKPTLKPALKSFIKPHHHRGSPAPLARRAALSALAALTSVVSSGATAQTTREPVMIAPSRPLDAFALTTTGTGFFVNNGGDVLTARHVVQDCKSLFIVKDARVARAHIRAVSAQQDLAVLSSSIKPLLAATLARTIDSNGAAPVFIAGYEVLRHMPDRATTMYNALTREGTVDESRAGELTLMSSATYGASGSPVLDQGGLVVGLVTERAQTLSRDPRAYALRGGASSYVIALSGEPIKAFLLANNVPFEQSDTAQLETMQAHAPRAATLEAGVLCGA